MHLQPESDRSLKENQMTLDLSKLWDYNKPDVSEQRFRAALDAADPDEQLILQTQIARTYGLRQDFARAQEILAAIEPQVQSASAEAQTRYFLELGRTYASTTHPPESQTSEALEKAKSAYLSAFGIAETAKLDNLAIDALHMMVVVETTPEDQLAWNMAALGYMEKSTQSDARKWEGSLRNNIGYALHLQGRYEEALAQFQLALAAHERSGNRPNILVAHWMIAWTLRSLGRLQEAVEIQLRLEREWDELGEPDPYVFEELEHLYRALGDAAKAEHYAQRRQNPV
jgi:tetratricopeptide (TPR) repeat protein